MDIDFLKSIGLDDESLAQKVLEKHKEEETGLLSKRDELLGKVTKYKEDLSKYEGVDLDEYVRLKKKMEELNEKDLIDKGDFEAIKKKMLDQFEQEKGGLLEQTNTLKSQLESMMVDSEAAKAIAELGGNHKLLMPLIKQRISVVDKDGKIVVQVKAEDGTPAVDGKGNPISITDLVRQMKEDENYAGAFVSSIKSGGGARPTQTTANNGNDTLFGAARIRAAREK